MANSCSNSGNSDRLYFLGLCPASFHIPRPNLPVTPGVSWLPTFAFQSPIMKRTSFLGDSSRSSSSDSNPGKKCITDELEMWSSFKYYSSLLNNDTRFIPHIPIMFKWISRNIKAYEKFYSLYITYTISNTWTNTENRNFLISQSGNT